jgi:acyl-CoA thioesterase FadM/acyl carrier protein/NADP-dependent 3-hydroxy acid dehydrogenase YdfG
MRGLCDVFIEVGPGRTLSGLCRDIFDEDICIPLASNALKWNPNQAVAAAFVNGVTINWNEFYAQRLIRPYVRPSKRVYLSNPAERPIALESVSTPQGDPSLLANGQSFENALEGTLGRELGLNAEQLAEYLRNRGKFLAGVARLDMTSLAGSPVQPAIKLPEPVTAVQAPVSSRPALSAMAGGKPSLANVIELLVELISKRTGYPATSITAESRLLDDLNLDSIKAGELVAEALRRIGAAGAIDATRFANASIQAIATALHDVAPEAAPAVAVMESPRQESGAAATITSAETIVELLLDLVSQRTGYPRSSIAAESRLLDDLNLDSIKAGELVAEALRRIGAAGAIDATRFANTSIQAIAAALVEVLPGSHPSATASAPPSKANPLAQSTQPIGGDLSFVSRYTTWTRNYVVRAVPMPREAEKPVNGQRGDADLAGAVFLIFLDPRDREPADALFAEIAARGGLAELAPFDAAMRAALQSDSRFTHQIAVLPRVPGQGTPAERLAGMLSRVTAPAQAPVKNALADRPTTVAYVQFGGGCFGSDASAPEPELCNALAFARTLHLERKDLRVRVLDFAKSAEPSTVAGLVLDELAGGESFAAAGFDDALMRRVPLAELSEPVAYRPRQIEWSERDVILVTGGAKGIVAECALGVARETGATLVLVGRGEPVAEKGGGGDSEIDRTLERFRAEGLRHRYFSCNIVDSDALEEVVRKIEADVGAITGVIHGASILRPSRTENLTVDGLLQEVSPKVLGAWNLCRVLNGRPLKLFAAFSSLVADHGMPWSAGYAFANEAMERVVETAALAHSMPLQIVSFGLWGHVGRPAVLKTNDHLLSVGLHDGEIPPEEGVRRFVEAFTFDPGTQRLCIYGRSAGYPTWDHLRPKPAIPANLRFIERVLHHEPDVELIARCRLTLERDRYLHGHVYNGMYIVPTVLALEVIAQAAYALAGGEIELCRLDAVEMPYPIVVDPAHGLDIELRAEVQEAAATGGFRRVNVSVSTELTGFKTSALSGTVVFGPRRDVMQEPVVLGTSLPIDAGADLYGRQFFVGPMYQRMGAIYSVDPDKTVCIGEIHTGKDAAREAFNEISGSPDGLLVLGDPFFRDTLLHSSLLHHLDHMAFTSRIDKIELFGGCEPAGAEQRLCVARLQWSNGKDAEFELVAASASGQVFERWTGYCSKALAKSSDWPQLQDLLDIGRTKAKDERELSGHVASAASRVGVAAPFVVLECINGFADLPVEERHVHERALAARALTSLDPAAKQIPALEWTPEGRPRLDIMAGLDISFSHEGWYCLCAAGADAQGCDLAAISQRSQAEWHSLFGAARQPLLAALSAEEPLDVAGTRMWAALEAARKALATDNEELTAVKRLETSVLFRARALDKEVLVLTLPLRFTHGRQSIVALTVKIPPVADEPSAVPGLGARIVRDERLGCDVLEHEFSVTWKECMTPSRKAMPVCYVDWFHRTREAMLAPQDARRWVAGVLDGTAGLVARSIRVQLHDEVTAHDELCARIWVAHVSERVASWRVDFYKKLARGARRLVATIKAEGGMVGASSKGNQSRGALSAIRDYRRFVQTQPSIPRTEESAGFGELQRGRPIFEVPAGPRGGPLLFSETMRPSLIDSDLVGNVSSIKFFGWLAHVRDRFLHSVVPQDMVRRLGTSGMGLGEALCIDEEMVYLREAFPFDEITVEMRLIAATERSARIRYEFMRKKLGTSEKIAAGHQQLLWVHRDGDAGLRSESFPPELLRLLNPRQPAEHSELR